MNKSLYCYYLLHFYYLLHLLHLYNITINLYTIIIIINIIIINLTHSKTILENTVEIEPQPVTLDFKNLSQYSSRSK